MAIRMEIEDTGIGVRIHGDDVEPGHRVWRVVRGGNPAYILVRSIFCDDDDRPPVPPSITEYQLIESTEAFFKLMERVQQGDDKPADGAMKGRDHFIAEAIADNAAEDHAGSGVQCVDEAGQVEFLARVMAFAKVGDPNAKDNKNEPRWKWLVHDAERYLQIHPSLFASLSLPETARGREPTGIEAAQVVADYLKVRFAKGDEAGDAANIIHVLHKAGVQFGVPSSSVPSAEGK